MRRALLTTGSRVAGPVSVGDSSGSESTQRRVTTAWTNAAPASGSGFLNNSVVSLDTSTFTGYAFFTVSPANVVTAVSSTVMATLGYGTAVALPEPLAVNAGDYIGIWFDRSVPMAAASAASGITAWSNTAAGKPTVGATISSTASIASSRWKVSAAT